MSTTHATINILCRLSIFVLSTAVVSADSECFGIVIDDFKNGPFPGPDATLEDTSSSNANGVVAVVSGLPEHSVLEGERLSWLRVVAGAEASLAIDTSGTGQLVFQAAPSSSAAMQLVYGGGGFTDRLNVDLGANNQEGFEFLVSEAPMLGKLYIAVNATNGQFFSPSVDLTGPGVYRFPYSQIINEFGPDAVVPSLATTVFWGIYDIPGTQAGIRVLVDELRTYSAIPEPTTLGLIYSSLVACLATTNRRRNHPAL